MIERSDQGGGSSSFGRGIFSLARSFFTTFSNLGSTVIPPRHVCQPVCDISIRPLHDRLTHGRKNRKKTSQRCPQLGRRRQSSRQKTYAWPRIRRTTFSSSARE